MIIYKRGDLLKSSCNVIAHGVNCQGIMSAGIALAIKNKYPKVFEEYVKNCKTSQSNTSILLGNILPVFDEQTNVWVVNLFTQNYYGSGKQISYDAIDTSMSIFASWCSEQKDIQIGIPQIGAGLGGGNWDVISAIVNANFKNKEIEVYIL